MSAMSGAYADEHLLVLACQAGENAALAAFYNAFFLPVYRYALASIGSVQDAEDVCAEVFVKALLNIGSYEDQQHSVQAWLFRIARNEVADFYRRKKRRVQTVHLDPQQIDGLERSDPVETKGALMDLADALRVLPRAQQEAFLLRVVTGLSTREAARTMRIPEGTLRSHLHFALRALRETLQDR